MRLDMKRRSFDGGDPLFFLQKESIVIGFPSDVSPNGFNGINVAGIKAS
jgi:hypothetical protein